LLATVLVCLITGLLASVEVYAAQLVWPGWKFPDVDTAYVHVAGRAGGPWLFGLINVTLLVATVGSGMGSQLGAARLLYGMGRGNAIPKSFFGAIEPKRRIPRNNVLFVGTLALTGAYILSFERAAELLNFGALLAFMGVNASAFVRYHLRAPQKTWSGFFSPIAGFVVCLLLWLNLSWPAKVAGSIWMVLGIAYGAARTHGFKAELVTFDVPEDAE
jgi:amino acid transporter